MTKAENKLNALGAEVQGYLDAGRDVPVQLLGKGLQASDELDDARARYASTPQGKADLNHRMDLLIASSFTGGRFHINLQSVDDYDHYAQAVSEGNRIRSQARNIRASVKAGTLTSAQATALAQYPTDLVLLYRQQQITTRLQQYGGSKPEPPHAQAAYETHMDAIWAGTAEGFSEQNLRAQLAQLTTALADLNAHRITPPSIIGATFPGATNAARAWLTDQIATCTEALATRGRSHPINQFNTTSALRDLDAP